MEGTLEKIEEAAKLNDVIKVAKLRQFNNFLRKPWILPTATAVGGIVVGYAFGYVRTKRQYDRIEEKLDDLEARQNVVEAVEEWAPKVRQVDPEEARWQGVSDIQDAATMRALRADHPSSARSRRPIEPETVIGKSDDVRSEGVVSNVFDTAGDEWDYKTEVESRTNEAPYVIHVDEYVNDEMGWDSQSTLTWYEKDQVLCDSHDRPIYNHSDVVGELLFGHGSNDPNVVYIRNPKLQAEYEILRDEGSYEEIVLGEQIEQESEADDLRHSAVLRMRRE